MQRRIGKIIALACTGIMVLVSWPAEAQRKGQSVKVQYGVVVSSERVNLNDSKATQGAIVGGGIALVSSSGKSGKRKRRNAAAGALIGSAFGAAAGGSQTGMLYTVAIAGGAIKVVTDQTEIHHNDCVMVEETAQGANIRRVDPVVCDPATAELVEELQEEFQEEAAECAAAKAEAAAAETEAQLDLAMRKISILCN